MRIAIKAEVIALAILLGISVSLRAQTPSLQSALNLSADQYAALTNSVEQTDPIPADGAPVVGMFYSAQNPALMPLPGNFNNLPAWDLGNMVYLLDDFGFDPRDAFGRRSKEDGAPPPPGAGGGGGGGGYTNTFHYSLDTNGLWLEMTGVSNGLSYLNLHNATNQVYAIWSTTDVMSGWNVETEVWPTNVSAMPFTVEMSNRPNLFMQAEDWTGVTNNGNTTPDWWFWEYFGTTALSDTNLDPYGNTLSSDYQNGMDPNVITFTLNSATQYFNTSEAAAGIDVSAGMPYYMAVLMDDTNWSDAVWIPYSLNIVANLGTIEGWHTVWVGVKGLPANAQQTWNSMHLDLILTPPSLVITNPPAPTVMQPIIEVQGYCPEPLASLTFDLSNSAGFFTNQPASVLSQQFDPVSQHFTTNTFQAFDVPLATGANTLIFHAADLAGNTTTTNVTYTLDYSSKTNPPVIEVFWPQNGDLISGTEFTIRGSLDDFTATLTAQMVDANGDTNILQGLVERNGLFWVENAPLAIGVNYITLTAVDAVGNTSSTNIVVSNIDSALTIDDFSDELGGDPQTVIPIVTGTIALTNYTLWVNGVEAIQNGDGTWYADSVPVGPGGTAVVEARAIPNTPGDNDGNGTPSAQSTDGTPGNPTAADSVTAQRQADQPTTWYIKEYHFHTSTFENTTYASDDCTASVNSLDSGQYDQTNGSGGQAQAYESIDESSCTGSSHAWESWVFNWPCDSCPAAATSVDDSGTTNHYISTSLDAWGTAAYNASFVDPVQTVEWTSEEHVTEFDTGRVPTEVDSSESIVSKMELQTGGKGLVSRRNLFEIDVSAIEYRSWAFVLTSGGIQYTDVAPIPGTAITVAGLTANGNGQVFTVLQDNITVDITPQAPPEKYTYSVNPKKYKSTFFVYVDQPVPLGAGTPRVWTPSDRAGHCWWMLKSDAPTEGLSLYMQTNLLSYIGVPAGFGPLTEVGLTSPTAPGVLRFPEPDLYFSAFTNYSIGFDQFIQGLTFTRSIRVSPPQYDLYHNNCVDTDIKAGASVGVTIPDEKGPKSYSNPEWFGFGLEGENP